MTRQCARRSRDTGRTARHLMLALLIGVAAQPAMAEDARIFSAGSLRGALNEATELYAQAGGQRYAIQYGPSGKLRERIEGGDIPALFASASVEHVERLQQSGILRSNVVLTHNRLCVLARPGLSIGADDAPDSPLRRLMDPALRLTTSTPKNDPAGDYTWEIFRKIDAVYPGAFDALSRRADQALGKDAPPPVSPSSATAQSAYLSLLSSGKTDLIVSYCTALADAQRVDPAISGGSLPDPFNVDTAAAIGAARSAGPDADRLIEFLTGPQGRAIFARYGFR